MESESQSVSFAGLPDPCLLEVLRCCADDLRSLFSAARAHSRLHQAAVAAASSIGTMVTQQRQADSVLLYLANHGHHLDSLTLEGLPVSVPHLADYMNKGVSQPGQGLLYRNRVAQHGFAYRELPHDSLHRLSSLDFGSMSLQLQPGSGLYGGRWGVLGGWETAGAPLRQLRLDRCKLLDGQKGLAAALLLLPDLQYLSVAYNYCDSGNCVKFPGHVLQALPLLTALLLTQNLQEPDDLRHLQGLTGMQDLRLSSADSFTVLASMLSGLQYLTHLELKISRRGGAATVEAGALAGTPQLQHLELTGGRIAGGSAGVSQLLLHLQPLQQLTHLNLCSSLDMQRRSPPAAAFSALTASSKLQHLNLSKCWLPAGVWQHMFPSGRQLPHLLVLDLTEVTHQIALLPDGAPVPEASRLVSCCPGLRSLLIGRLQYSAERLGALTGLRSLRELQLDASYTRSSPEWWQVVGQLTGLEQLDMYGRDADVRLLLQLTQLKLLTHLHFGNDVTSFKICGPRPPQLGAPSKLTVWRQVWQHLLSQRAYNKSGLVLEAAAAFALEELELAAAELELAAKAVD